MLIKFKMENYKSFKNLIEFPMSPAPKQKGLDYSIIRRKFKSKNIKGLCSSVIYGPNAAGKTTIIGAMDTMRTLVLRGHIRNIDDDNPNIAANSLELIPNNTLTQRKPVTFSVQFFEEGFLVDYSFSMDLGFFLEENYNRKIISESLSVNNELVFIRNSQLQLNHSKKHSCFYPNALKSFKNIENIAKDSLNDQELFLMNGFKLIVSRKMVEMISNWFENKLMVVYQANSMNIVKKFVDPQKPTFYIEKTTNEAAKIFGLHSNAIGYLVNKDDQKATLCSMFVNSKNNEKIVIRADSYESYGTLRFINIFPLVMKSLNTGGTLVIDEFDASIHPMALMNIVNIYHDDEINKKGAQLIFDTHNPIFLNSNLFRRDEIKFVERNNTSHISDLYSLSDFGTSGESGVRKNEDYMKNYFISQYGAISEIDFSPIFKNLIQEGEEDG